ncbi:MAG: tetratricopeptide repeat protein [Nostocaceae cyanobacterium]|nr:tetratricopeptide repeat protein [Nostocaceae cyanobacterium]
MQINPINPYIIGRPIKERELFFGREDVFDFINDNLIKKQQIILLHGQRRIGKSSLLYQITRSIQNNFVCVLFDLQDKVHLALSDVIFSLATEIVDSLDLSSESIKVPSVKEFKENTNIFSNNFLPEIYQALGDKNIVLLLDEFDVLNNTEFSTANQHFFSYLEYLIKQQEKLFVIPVVGRQLEDMKKMLVLFKGAPRKEIGLLSEEDAKQLICKPAEGLLEYKPDAIRAILDLSAGHPYFTQILCFAIFMGARKKQRQQVNCADVENIIEQAMEQQVNRADVENIIEQAMEMSQAGLVWFREGLSIPEKVIFSAVAELQQLKIMGSESAVQQPLELLKQSGVVETKALQKAETRLVKWKFLQKRKKSKVTDARVSTYTVKIELVRRWLVKQYSLTEVIYQLENIDEKANQLYKQAREIYHQGKIDNAINVYEQVLETNPNHFSALFELAEAYLEFQEFPKAIELYTRAYKIEPIRYKEGLVELLLNYGESLMSQRQLDAAAKQFNYLLTIDSNNKIAKRKLAKVEEELRKLAAGPYYIGKFVPPSQFLGRENELDIALTQIFRASSWVFYGSPGKGKTSFLKYLAAPEIWQQSTIIKISNNKYIFTYIDCEIIDNFSSSAFWKEVLSEIKEVLRKQKEKYQNDNPIQSIMENIDSLQSEIDKLLKREVILKNDIKLILQHIYQQDKYLVLLLDNYDYILETKNDDNHIEIVNFLREFRNLADHHAYERLATIMTSSKPLDSVTTYNDLLPYISLPLPPFQEPEVVALWNQMPEALRQKDDLRIKIQTMTGGYPVLLQMVCFLLYKQNQQANFSVNTLAKQLDNTIIRAIWNSLNDIERMLIRWIALDYVEGRIEKKSYDLSDIDDFLKKHNKNLNDLETRGIIISNNQSGKKIYALAASLMHDWVINEIINSSPEEIKDRERVFLKMNKGHVKQMKTAMDWVKENTNVIKSIAVSIQELIKVIAV